MKIFDTHCHLNHDDFYKNVGQIIKEANAEGVDSFLVVGYDKESSLRALNLANKYKGVYAAIGFHPTDIDVSEEEFDSLMKLLDNPKVVAIGEIGLDYHWVKDPLQRKKQREFFVKQINIANKYNLPISIHSRDADLDTFNILKENPLKMGGIMHCYSGSVESAKELTKMNLLISLGGPLTFLNAKTPKEVARAIPLEKIVIETDAPYLAPHPHRGKTNQPRYIVLVLEELSKIKNLPVEEVANITYENARKMFHV